MATNKIKRFGSKKSHSWWWDSHISPKNSHWLNDNLQEMDKQVKEMLTLIDEEGDSFAKNAENYYQKRPQLISSVETFYRMYRSLAERYDNVTKELKKNIPKRYHSEDSLNGSNGSDDSSNSSPEKKKKKRFFLGLKESSDSDSSESENESEKESKNEFTEKISELEEELKEAKGKVLILEEKNLNFEELEKELVANRYEIECLKGEMEASSDKFNVELANRDFEIVKLKEEFESASRRFLEEKLFLEDKIFNIEGLNKGLKEEMEIIVNEKLVIESKVCEFEKEICDLKVSNKVLDEEFLVEKSNFEDKIKELSGLNSDFEDQIKELSSLNLDFKAKIEGLEMYLSEKENQISQLNENIVTITSQFELTLNEKKSLEEKIINMYSHLNVLHLEHAKLSTEIEAIKKENVLFKGRINDLENKIRKQNDMINENTKGFNERVKELEKEIEKQNDLLFEYSENKREAIRQLCISVEYYREEYFELRKLVKGNKRHLVMVN